MKKDGVGCNHFAFVVAASSLEAAERTAAEATLERFPRTDGWKEHSTLLARLEEGLDLNRAFLSSQAAVKDGTRISDHVSLVWDATSEGAQRIAMTEALMVFPSEEGWADHSVVVEELQPMLRELETKARKAKIH